MRIFISFLLAPILASAATITLDSSKTYQTMNGWIAASFGMDGCGGMNNYMDTLLKKVIVDMGLQRPALSVKSGAENPIDYYAQYRNGSISYNTWRAHRYEAINDNSDPDSINWAGFHFTELDAQIDSEIIPFRKAYKTYSGDTAQIDFGYIGFIGQVKDSFPSYTLIHDNSEEYAEFILASFLHMQNKYGFVPGNVELCLEPDWMSSRGTLWSGTILGQHMLATITKLTTHGFHLKYSLPSVSFIQNLMPRIKDFIKTAGKANVTSYVNEFRYHLYSQPSNIDALRKEIADTAAIYGVKTAMTEAALNDGGNGTAKELYRDLTIANVSSWSQFCAGWCGTVDNGGAYYYWDTTNYVIHLSKYARYFPLYFRYIREGAKRIDAHSTDSNFDPVSFINIDGHWVTIVKADAAGSFSVKGLPAGTYGLRYTTVSELEKALPDQILNSGDSIFASIPDSGILAIDQKPGASAMKPASFPGRAHPGGEGLRVIAFPGRIKIIVSNNPDGLDFSIRLYTLTGKTMNLFTCSGSGEFVWHHGGNSHGIYIVKARAGGRVWYEKKILVQ